MPRDDRQLRGFQQGGSTVYRKLSRVTRHTPFPYAGAVVATKRDRPGFNPSQVWEAFWVSGGGLHAVVTVNVGGKF